MEKVIARGKDSGVYFGTLESQSGQEVVLKDVRMLYYYSGAFTTLGLAKSGVSKPNDCKFTDVIDEITLLDCCAIIPCTAEAITSLESVNVWKI
jgi:hypothetical protein